MPPGKKVRVKIRTVNAFYEGELLVPPIRNRVSDVLNEEERLFINLTDVQIDGSPVMVPFVALNKEMIESIIESLETP